VGSRQLARRRSVVSVTEQHFQASADRVFDAIVDARHYPRWLVGAQEVHPPDGWPAPGTSFEHTVGFGPIKLHDRSTSVSIGPGRTFQLVVRARPVIEADVRFEVRAVGEGSVLIMDERPRGVFRLAAPLVGRAVGARNARSLQRLAELLDERSSSVV
jgi:hypothetical protein